MYNLGKTKQDNKELEHNNKQPKNNILEKLYDL
jgi:hypothetical protein